MKQSEQTSNKRWYDKDPDIARAFDTFQHMKTDHRTVLGQVIIIISQRLKEQNRNGQGLISIGTDRVMGLMKAQQKRRSFDQDKIAHKAITNLYVLTDAQRDLLAERIYISVACIQEYAESCLRHGVREDYRELTQLVTESLDKGLRAAEKYLIARGLYDDEMAENLSRLSNRGRTPVVSTAEPAETGTEVAPTAQEVRPRTSSRFPQPTPNPSAEPAAKHKAKLLDAGDGMKISKQDLL